MTSYDPFERGAFPVGVRSASLVDETRERPLTLEVWYPATDAWAGRDCDETRCDHYETLPGFPKVAQLAARDAEPREGRFPLVVFSHGFGGHRRQTTHLCTHLASHGYVVAAPDHTGNTMLDLMQLAMGLLGGGGGDRRPDLRELAMPMIEARPPDLIFTADAVLDGRAGDLADRVDARRIGVCGHSFGGWTTLTVPSFDDRFAAALPLAPAGGRTPLAPSDEVDIGSFLRFDWKRDVPTLLLAAERDTLLPLDGVRELFERTPSSHKRLVVLRNADHMHFCDRIEETHELFRTLPIPVPELAAIAGQVRPIGELCPPEAAYSWLRGLGLAHFDAWLRDRAEARALLDGDLAALCSARGIEIL
jgi:predicted dienelactone hydrolase